ncbi:thiamin pyrophosphokinase 2 isoform X2 [Narcine bancroftii]|uniref:thiamin pyrophosphokinase 2 isoform X2 n=1 Tax=Narcine bancroftii TaxID=1343680 RepID=UPI003831D34B
MAASTWAQRVLQLLDRMNSFHSQGSTKATCAPFYVAGQEVGVIQPRVRALLSHYRDVFRVSPEKPGWVELREGLDTYHARSQALKHVLEHWREREMFDCLRGWRNESYEVMARFCDEPLMEMERSGASLFGIKTYGVHVNGYVRQEGGGMAMWIGRRSRTKQTFPGMLDNMSAGGLSARSGVLETLVRECAEESCIPQSVALSAKPAGSVSYTYEDQRGVFPQCQFVYDLEVPAGLAPQVGDGEVQEFYLWPLEKHLMPLMSGSNNS